MRTEWTTDVSDLASTALVLVPAPPALGADLPKYLARCGSTRQLRFGGLLYTTIQAVGRGRYKEEAWDAPKRL